MKATPAKTLRARPDSQRPPEQQLRPRFYDSPTTQFDGSSASSNSSIDLAPSLILRKEQTQLGQIDSLSTTPNVQQYSRQSKENSDLPRPLRWGQTVLFLFCERANNDSGIQCISIMRCGRLVDSCRLCSMRSRKSNGGRRQSRAL